MNLRTTIAAALILGAALTAVAQSSQQQQNSQQMTWKGDSDFASKMSMHHRMGIAMNGMCEKKAARTDLKHLCSKMAEGQERDIAKLQAIPSVKIDPPHHAAAGHDPHHGMAGTQSDSAKKMDPERARMHQEGMSMHEQMTQASGEKFDAEFLKNMSKHHEQAIMMSQQCEQKSQSGELKKLCSEMKTTQQAERKEMSTMLSRWYPKETGTTAGANTPEQ